MAAIQDSVIKELFENGIPRAREAIDNVFTYVP
jgi:hypothetical protein